MQSVYLIFKRKNREKERERKERGTFESFKNSSKIQFILTIFDTNHPVIAISAGVSITRVRCGCLNAYTFV